MSDEGIDMNKLSQKELLIRLYDHLKSPESTVLDIKNYSESRHDKIQEQITKLAVRLAVVETKAAVYGAIAGLIITVIIKTLI